MLSVTCRRPISTHRSATLLALAVAVSLGAAGSAAAVAPAGLGMAEAPASRGTLLQRITAAAKSLMGQAEAQANRRLVRHRPALRAATHRPVPPLHRVRLGSPRDQLTSDLLNLPPPARA